MGSQYYKFVVLPECSIDCMPYYTLPRALTNIYVLMNFKNALLTA